MRFPRNARIFRGRLDAAPLAAVFFLLVIFLMLGSLVYTPGVRLELPAADNVSGTDQPTIAVAVDSHGRLYFENQLVLDERQLTNQLYRAAVASSVPLTLLIQADGLVTTETLVHLTMLARTAGITNGLIATSPRSAAHTSASPPP